MQRIAIQDANILIDLIRTGLLDQCMNLPYEFATTTLIFEELHALQQEEIKVHIAKGKFSTIMIADEDLASIQNLAANDSKLSEQDWSGLYFAEKSKGILLTGDKWVRMRAESRNIEVHGTLWILDMLIDFDIVPKDIACEFLEKLINTNSRLPVGDCRKRRELWGGS